MCGCLFAASLGTLGLSAVLATAQAGSGCGDFEAYVRGVDQGDVLWMREGPGDASDKVYSIPSDADGIHVIWCEPYSCSTWCDVTYRGKRGWVKSRYIENVESGL